MRKRQSILIRLALVAAVALAWEAASRTGAVNPLLLPPLSEVLARLYQMVGSPAVLADLGVTMAAVLVAFVFVAPIGVGIGLLLAESDYFGRAFRSWFYFLTGVPKSVFLPIFILLFGISFSEQVAFGIFQAVFVLIITTVAAVSCVQPELVRVGKVNGASTWAIYREIYWPSMLPMIVEGMRLGMIFNITGVLFAEMYAARAGFGARIENWGRTFDMPDLFAGVLLVTILTISVNEALRVYEKKVGKWRV
jgi:ABC-type nitrate/sulfonate/bicarbonate transport system permease component